MKQLTTRLCLICIFLFVHITKNNASSLDIKHVDSLYHVGKYLEARIGYEQLIFDNPLSTKKNEFLLKKSFCYKQLGDFQNAIVTLNRANLFDIDTDETNAEIRYELTLNYFLNKEYVEAQTQIVLLKKFGKKYLVDDFEKKIVLVEILTLNELNHWSEAKIRLEQYFKKKNINYDIISQEYNTAISLKFKKKKTARVLSTFLPGTGQIYGGEFFKGVLSGGIQGGLVVYGAYSLHKGYFFSGAIPSIALFYTFYTGGIRYAIKLVDKSNQRKKEKVNLKLNQEIIKNWSLIKN